MTSVKFLHGLGDCSNFAHMIPLWQRRGHEIEISCDQDKEPIFRAVPGLQIVGSAARRHDWWHPPGPAPGYRPSPGDGYVRNKAAWNLAHGGLPHIGSEATLWQEYKNVKLTLEDQITDQITAAVCPFLENLPRPLTLLALKGNTSSGQKNYPDDKILQLYTEILSRVGGTCLALDWDNRVPVIDDPRVFHAQKHFKWLTVLELWLTIESADCLVSIDSGPMHFARFTDTPVIGIWSQHYPSHYALPRENSVHLCPDHHAEWNEARREEYHIIPCPGSVPPPAMVADQVAALLGGAGWPLAPVQREITVDVCQGIGDIFWAYQRLAPHYDKIHMNIMCFGDDAVQVRARDWPSLWPKVGRVNMKRVSESYYKMASERYIPLSSVLDGKSSVYGVNHPLEQSIRLESTDPYPVAWDVPIRAEEWTLPYPRCWAVYVCGNLNFWSVEQWARMISLIRPPLPLVLIGASYDKKALDPLAELLRREGMELQVFIDLAPARVIHLLQKVDYLIGYQSGIGVLADNLGTPQTMIYFPHLGGLHYSWCHPDHVRSVFHASSFASSPEQVAEEIRGRTPK